MFDHGLERALSVALAAHEGQTRKGSSAPYAVHPLHVALMLAHLGADVEVAQAGLLHDVVEDCEEWTVARVEEQFGARVASIVAELTEDKDRPWRERKEHAIAGVPELSADAVLVKACDKLQNLQSLGQALREAEDAGAVWARFNGGRERSLEVAERLVRALAPRVGTELAASLHAALEAVRRH